VITAVEVVGARSVTARQVAAWTGFDAGKPFTRDGVANGIRRLFATQKFADVFVYAQPDSGGVRLLVNLIEYPRIRQVVFRGNDKVKRDDLAEAFPPTVGQYANPAAITRDLEKIRELYQDRGYYNATVHTDSTRIDQGGLADVVVSIDEGRKVKTKSIAFVGNSFAKTDDLRGAMKQKTSGFLRSGAFKKKQLEEDRERIVAWYRDRGFLDAAVTGVEENLADDRESMHLVVKVSEGERYTVGDINWSDNRIFDDTAVSDRISLRKGQVFSEGEYQRMLQELQSLYYDNGHIYATIEPVREIREGAVNLTLRFREGEPAHVRNIAIVDNTKTYDRVILRELEIFPGDVFSNSKVARSQRDIFTLGYFEDVQVEPRPTGEDGDIDLIFKVKEKQTGQFSFGMAYSAQTSVTGFIQVAENNFRGKGQTIGVAWQFGSRRRYVDLNFTEPWFRGTPTTIGADLFDRYQYNFDDFYESRVRGFAVRLGRRIPGSRYSRVGLRYELSATRLANFSTNYVNYLDGLEDQLGSSDLPFERLDRVDWPRTKSALTLSFGRNSTDNPFFPTSGSRANYSVELSGGPLGADIDYQKHLGSYSYFQRLPGGFALNLRAQLGLIVGLDAAERVPDYEKFRLGGNRIYPLRGYQDLEVVPRGNPGFIGGRAFSILNTEILYPLTKAVHVLAFLDQGDAWNSFGEADFTNLRKGAGFGVRLEVPMMGQIGFDYGYGFDRAGGPAWEPHFNFGTFF
jgi:outer membrane protein insertion porin family